LFAQKLSAKNTVTVATDEQYFGGSISDLVTHYNVGFDGV
jgi:hypothetical protein